MDHLFASFTPRDYVILVGIVLAQIPFVIMLKYFRETGIRDFLLGAGIMVSGSLSLLSTQFFSLHLRWLYIFGNICFMTTYFLLFLHSIRYRWEQPPRVLQVVGIGLYLAICGGILLYRVVKIEAMETMIFGFDMVAINRKTGEVPTITGISSLNGKVIIGSAFLLLIDLYRIFSATIFLYVYYRTPLSYSTRITERNRKIVLTIAVLNIIHPVLMIGMGLQLMSIPYVLFNAINASFIVLLAYIGIVHPETLSLSNVQVIRTLSMYKLLDLHQESKQRDDYFLGMKAVMEYIDRILSYQPKNQNSG